MRARYFSGMARWMSRKVLIRSAAVALLALIVLAGLSLLHPQVRYVVVAATYQLELLWGRIPVEQAISEGRYDADEVDKLRRVTDIKRFALDVGLADTGHYSTINADWDRTIYNVSACDAAAFRPQTWSFPIVGQVPYLGFFDEDAARAQEAELLAQGLDVHVRTAGAYSTLGWFEDPLMPHMLTWDEARLANTLLHELTHATVWIPGSVMFNESFANFVGNEAGLRYLVETYGQDSEQVNKETRRRADYLVYQRMMRQVYEDLDAVYSDPGLDREAKLERKAEILASLPRRARNHSFSDRDKWAAWFEKESWNNARLVQFRVYNRSPQWFAAVLRAEDGDLGRFIERVQAITRGADDPYEALEAAAGR